jgi:FtsP/CotA-like multicopper oxidase with cupredoxin domain
LSVPLSRRSLLWGLLAAGVAGSSADAEGVIELRARPLPAPEGADAFRAAFYGRIPGPLLRGKQGREILIRVHNELDEGISVHWHGVRLPNAMDGTVLTQAPIEPGRRFDYVFVPPDAGTFFYRATASNSLLRARGLHGMFLVEGAPEERAFDVPLVLDDGELGPLVNGARQPSIAVPADRPLRLRFLNAAAALAMPLVLSAEGADVIAFDGQPAEPLRMAAAPFELWPGQRLDVALPPSRSPVELSMINTGEAEKLASILRHGMPVPVAGSAVALKPNPLPDYFNYAASHQLSLTIERGQGSRRSWLVNGHRGLSRDPMFSVPRDSTIALTVDNISRSPHVLHLHGHAASLIELAGRFIETPVWRDTFLVKPLEPAKLLFIADNPGKWLIASTLPRIFDEGLAAWFEVT